MIKKAEQVYNRQNHAPVDGRYDDQFYSEMSEYYTRHHKKHDSPTRRLVEQKEATVKVKTADPNNKDKQLYLTDRDLRM